MHTAIIVDDEPLAIRKIQRFLLSHSDFEVLCECQDAMTAARAISVLQPDLIFMDIQLPKGNGLDVMEQAKKSTAPAVVFTTAHEGYAQAAFEADAVDYMLKPFGQERFDDAIERFKRRMRGLQEAQAPSQLLELITELERSSMYLDRLPVSVNGRILLVKVEDICWIEAKGNRAWLHTSKHSFDTRGTMASIEAKLNPRRFTRIHRSTIVNVEKIREISPWFNGYHLVVLEDGKELRMSRYQAASGKRLLGR
jgi:two-component system, LytTR family, response regulator